MKTLLNIFYALIIAFFVSSCAITAPLEGDKPTGPPVAEYVNPHPAGTYEHFQARLEYLKGLDIYRNEASYAAALPSETKITLDLNTLRGKLYDKSNTVILDYPITPGTSEHPTPTGSFKITEKIVDKESNLYGKILNANGSVIKSDADSRKDSVPRGGRFDGADMPYWMRLTGGGIGMHQGYVPTNPRRTASHGCIRHTMDGVTQVFQKVRVGTPVTIIK